MAWLNSSGRTRSTKPSLSYSLGHLLVQRQFTPHLVKQLDRLLSQSLKVRSFRLVAWPQERDERRHSRDRQPGTS
jgi:hypothetical protein